MAVQSVRIDANERSCWVWLLDDLAVFVNAPVALDCSLASFGFFLRQMCAAESFVLTCWCQNQYISARGTSLLFCVCSACLRQWPRNETFTVSGKCRMAVAFEPWSCWVIIRTYRRMCFFLNNSKDRGRYTIL